MAVKKAETEVATVEAPSVAVIEAMRDSDAAEIMEAMRENLEGETLSAWSLPRIKINPGGAPAWNVNFGDGESLHTGPITGVIVEKRNTRAFWAKDIDEGGAGSPPDCVSLDGVIGIGEPGGECATCPLNQFQTAKGKDGKPGRGKACNETRQLFILTEQSPIIPALITLPATSIKPLTSWMTGRAGKGLPYWKNQVELSLEGTKNADGIAYAQLVIRPGTTVALSPEQAEMIKAHKIAIAPILGDNRIIEQALTDEGAEGLAGVS